MEIKKVNKRSAVFKYDEKGKKIKPDFWSMKRPYYYNSDVVEYEVRHKGKYYGTVHVPKARTEKELKGTAESEQRYWNRIRKLAEERARKIYPGMKKLNAEEITYHFVQFID